MKNSVFVTSCFLIACAVNAQNDKQQYPTPEFVNTIYHFDKANGKLTKLEKEISRMETKVKLGGIGGVDNGFIIEGKSSSVRIKGGENLSFVYFTGSGQESDPQNDSLMLANGIDPSSMNMGMDMLTDPSSTASLYSVIPEGGKRKVTLQMSQGMKMFGKDKKASIEYSFSVKKVTSGYYEIVIDKTLPAGEYAFSMMNMIGGSGMDGSTTMFAFGID
jgi:hypothetical protein